MTNMLLYKHNTSTELTKVMQLIGDVDYASLKEYYSWLSDYDYIQEENQIHLLVNIDKFIVLDDSISSFISLPFMMISTNTDVPLYVILEKSEKDALGVVTEKYLNRHYTKISKKAIVNKKKKVEAAKCLSMALDDATGKIGEKWNKWLESFQNKEKLAEDKERVKENVSMKETIKKIVKDLIHNYGCMICPCSTTVKELEEMAKSVEYPHDLSKHIKTIDSSVLDIALQTCPKSNGSVVPVDILDCTVHTLIKRADLFDRLKAGNVEIIPQNSNSPKTQNDTPIYFWNGVIEEKDFIDPPNPERMTHYQASKDYRQNLIQNKINRSKCCIPLISKTNLDKILESSKHKIQPSMLRNPGIGTQHILTMHNIIRSPRENVDINIHNQLPLLPEDMLNGADYVIDPPHSEDFSQFTNYVQKGMNRCKKCYTDRPQEKELSDNSKKDNVDFIVPELDNAAWKEIYKGISNRIYNDIIDARKRGNQIVYIRSNKYPLPQEIIDAYVSKGYRIVLTRTPKDKAVFNDYAYDFEMIKDQKAEYVDETIKSERKWL